MNKATLVEVVGRVVSTRKEAVSAVEAALQAIQSTCFDLHPRPEPVAIGTLTDCLYAQPVSLLCRLVAQQDRRTVQNRDEYVLAAIIQEVGSSHAATHVTTRQGDPRA